MREALDALSAKIAEIQAFVDAIGPAAEFLRSSKDSIVREHAKTKKRFDHATFFVVLYAGFEQFVEDLVWLFTCTISVDAAYTDLPDSLRDRHLKKSADLLARGMLGTGRYKSVSPESLVQNLHGCLSGATAFQMSRAAIVQHNANLRFDAVAELFAMIGIDDLDRRIRSSPTMVRWYAAEQRVPEGSFKELPPLVLHNRLVGIVDQRNDVAHGNLNDDLLDPDLLSNALKFIEALSSALFDQALIASLIRLATNPRRATAVDQVETPKKGGFVVIIRPPASRIYVGQLAFSMIDGVPSGWGRIEELMIEGRAVESVEPGDASTSVGLRLSFACKRTSRVFVLAPTVPSLWRA